MCLVLVSPFIVPHQENEVVGDLYRLIQHKKKRALSLLHLIVRGFWTTFNYSNKCTENSRDYVSVHKPCLSN